MDKYLVVWLNVRPNQPKVEEVEVPFGKCALDFADEMAGDDRFVVAVIEHGAAPYVVESLQAYEAKGA